MDLKRIKLFQPLFDYQGVFVSGLFLDSITQMNVALYSKFAELMIKQSESFKTFTLAILICIFAKRERHLCLDLLLYITVCSSLTWNLFS